MSSTDNQPDVPTVYTTMADFLGRIRELAEYGYAGGADNLPYGQSACLQILQLLDREPPPHLATVGEIQHFHHLRAMSLQRQPATIPDNVVEVTMSIFTAVMEADNTMRRRKFHNAYQYECRLGVAGWLKWGQACQIVADGPGKTKTIPAVATRYLIDPVYAERIKLELVPEPRQYGRELLERPIKDLG